MNLKRGYDIADVLIHCGWILLQHFKILCHSVRKVLKRQDFKVFTEVSVSTEAGEVLAPLLPTTFQPKLTPRR